MKNEYTRTKHGVKNRWNEGKLQMTLLFSMIGMNLMKYMEKEICFCISARKFSSTISCMTGDTALLEVYVSGKL